MDTHVRVLGVIHIAFGVLGLLAGVMLFVIFGGAAGIVGTVGAMEDPEALIAVPIISLVGAVIVGIVVILSIPSLAAGVGLLSYQNWARMLALILSVIGLLNVPIGTIVGAYGLWVLLTPETEVLFQRRGTPRPIGQTPAPFGPRKAG